MCVLFSFKKHTEVNTEGYSVINNGQGAQRPPDYGQLVSKEVYLTNWILCSFVGRADRFVYIKKEFLAFRVSSKILCNMDLHRFPHDIQGCRIKIESCKSKCNFLSRFYALIDWKKIK